MKNILIVGGGIAGLALANLLQNRSDLKIDLIEKQKEWRLSSTGLYTPANGVAALKFIGLYQKAIEKGHLIKKRIFKDIGNKDIMNIALSQIWGNEIPCLCISRKALHNVLFTEIKSVNIVMNCTINQMKQINDRVEVTLSNHTQKTYDLVIAADGLYSSVRKLVLGDKKLRIVTKALCRFITNKPKEIENWTLYGSSAGQFLAIPTSKNDVYCYVNNKKVNDINDSNYIKPFLQFPDPVKQMLQNFSPNKCYWDDTKELEAIDVFGKNRVVLIGDAAHAMPPFMAQGGALALEDAIVLSNLLKQPNWNSIAETFTAKRQDRINWTRAKNNRREKLAKLPMWVIKLGAKYYKGKDWIRDYQLLADFDIN